MRSSTLPNGMPATRLVQSVVVGLIGHPVEQSLLPRMQQAAFDTCGLPFRYELWDTPEERLAATVHSLRKGDRRGANVGAPYTGKVAELIDVVSDAASAIGAVNTIVRQCDRLVGYNTDVTGFTDALRLDAHLDVRGLEVAVLGSCVPGTARAVVFALLAARAARVWIHTRTPQRTWPVVAGIDHGDGRLRLTSGSPSDRESPLRNCAVIVHTTTLGLPGGVRAHRSYLEADEIPAGAVVFDLAAESRAPTRLLALAQARGCATFGAHTLLVRRAAVEFRHFTDRAAPVEAMSASIAS